MTEATTADEGTYPAAELRGMYLQFRYLSAVGTGGRNTLNDTGDLLSINKNVPKNTSGTVFSYCKNTTK
jgi:hypothetical protein